MASKKRVSSKLPEGMAKKAKVGRDNGDGIATSAFDKQATVLFARESILKPLEAELEALASPPQQTLHHPRVRALMHKPWQARYLFCLSSCYISIECVALIHAWN